ncbi:hypothetical protein Leryth_023226 [Lithospermum erythrorhizon]|nr:hypothetical protein Leryth_023226 [Lithospermum erythrorhizon]
MSRYWKDSLTTSTVVVASPLNSALKNSSSLQSIRTDCFQLEIMTRQELEEFLVDQTITLLRNQLTQGSKKILTLAEIKTAEKNGDYWVKGLLQIATEEQKFFYLGCNNCSAKISAVRGVEYLCYDCQKETLTLNPKV